MIAGLDHLVILSAALAEDARRYERLGFTVVPGGTHPAWGTENALIPLGDGTYLELLAKRRGGTPSHRFWRRSAGTLRAPGEFAGFALAATDLARTVAHLRAAGMAISDVQPGSRVRPDGRRVAWMLAFPEAEDLPFLIEDVTPRRLRIPAPRRGSLNAATGLARVLVAAGRQETTAAYTTLLGVDPVTRRGGPTAGVTFSAGESAILVCPPARHARPGIAQITLRLPARYGRSLPLVEAGGQRLIAPSAIAGAHIAIELGDSV